MQEYLLLNVHWLLLTTCHLLSFLITAYMNCTVGTRVLAAHPGRESGAVVVICKPIESVRETIVIAEKGLSQSVPIAVDEVLGAGVRGDTVDRDAMGWGWF